MPEDPLRDVALRVLPDPEHGHRAGTAGDGLVLPGTGEIGLAGGQALVPLAQTGQEGGRENAVEGTGSGRTGTMRRDSHGITLLADSRGRQRCKLWRLRFIVGEER